MFVFCALRAFVVNHALERSSQASWVSMRGGQSLALIGERIFGWYLAAAHAFLGKACATLLGTLRRELGYSSVGRRFGVRLLKRLGAADVR